MPEISIIVPVYKVEKYLDRCIGSILAQTYTDFELILVDDGSPDSCPAMCDAWAEKDARIRVVHKENGGLSSARNAGLDLMKGNYVTFIDSDDAVHPQMLEILLSTAIENDSQITFSDFESFFSDGLPQSARDRIENPETISYSTENNISRDLFVNFPNSAWMKLYSKSVFQKLRFKEGLIYEDLHLKPYILLEPSVKKITHCIASLYYYYKNPKTPSIIQSNFSEEKMFSAIYNSYDHYLLYKNNEISELVFIAAYQLTLNFVISSIQTYKNKSLRRTFRKYYRQYFFKILFLPSKYLSIKNKIIFASTVLPIEKLKIKYRDLYKNEPAFQNKNNILNYV